MSNDDFALYDLNVEVIHHDLAWPLACKQKLGHTCSWAAVRWRCPRGGSFGLFAMLVALPFVPAERGLTERADLMGSDAVISCTDPSSGAGLRVTRLEQESYSHAARSVAPISSS